MTSLKDLMSWRYATKKMDPAQAVPEDKVEAILEAIRMAPTSSGTQPFEVFVVTNDDMRAQIRKVGWDQSQITEGSHLLVFAAWDNYSAERIDAVRTHMEELRGENPMISQYYENLKGAYLPRDASVNHDHAARQAYIALGFAMLAAAELEVDCCPMEGFDADAVDEIMGLKELGLKSVTLLPLGYRQEGADWLLPMPRVRKSREAMIKEIK
ncbi:NAD(P)H-dependent oxidoreductase [Shimia sp. R11_0]|uniref:NAD(P)H-dependent oxidoreductase n=1 Tax=Shimia sp. R11_0 TaxID=2821096 RepID=UPI001ADA3911|nr:NAD(P)H-dependent oxidoreductase [Shimia sp. R11_0]MBO9477973.1 NAD(P)H-dependent oxidoreductase [Shimia sp. R11_0]